MCLCDGKPSKFTEDNLEHAVVRSDFVLLAVSNSFDDTLFAGQRAVENGIPYGIYAGSQPGCYLGANLEPLRQNCQLLFVFNHEEVAPAQVRFPKAKIVASGSPEREKSFQVPQGLTRETSRALAGVVADDELVIFVSGNKDLTLNILLFALSIEAAGKIDHRKFRIVIGLHPGDQNPISAYADLARFAPANVSVAFICREVIGEKPKDLSVETRRPVHILPGANLVVNVASNVGIQAACLRIPVICFFPPYGEIRLERSGIKPGEWEQERNGTALVVRETSVERLRDAMECCCPDGYDIIKERQKRAYPAPPEEGSAVSAVVNALESFQR